VAYGNEIANVSVHKVSNFISGLKPGEVAEGVAERIAAYAADHGKAITLDAPIAVAFPGPVRSGNTALSAPTLYGPACGQIPDLAALVRRRTGRSVYMLNDVSATAWALSRRTNVSRFMVVTVSSGIGSKVFDRDNRQGVLDSGSFAGEIGHYVVDDDPNAPLCDCGGRGHLGAIASGRGVERALRRESGIATLDNYLHIVPAIQRGENWALAALRSSIEPLARTLLAVTMAVGLERIFIVGGFAQNIGAPYAQILNETLVAQLRYPLAERELAALAQVVGLDEELGLLGAAYYASTAGES
jgi:glucokinase